MCKVIVNSTPLIVLCGIGQLSVLQRLYQEIIIPAAVYREVTAKENGFYVSAAVEKMILEQTGE